MKETQFKILMFSLMFMLSFTSARALLWIIGTPNNVWALIIGITMGLITLIERNTAIPFKTGAILAEGAATHKTLIIQHARAQEVIALCKEALRKHPGLTDATGTSLQPLVDEHLPLLTKLYGEARDLTSGDTLKAVEHDYLEGVERVRRTFEEALEAKGGQKHQELQTQLRFLQLRHPDENPVIA